MKKVEVNDNERISFGWIVSQIAVKMGKISSKTKKKQKFLIWLTIIITAVNFILAVGFIVYLYFWIKAR